jgi:methionyl-tRNA formyltransferase
MILAMKFVYFGYDFMLGAAHRLIKDGHELCGIFTFPCDNIFNFNIETTALANKMNVPMSLEKPSRTDIQNMKDKGAEVFIAAGYLFKIPDVSPAYGLNVHPSYLPKGRSIMPVPYIILDHPEAAGFTIHKLADEMDAGDILYQEQFTLLDNETVETFSGKIAAHAPDALSKIMRNLPETWNSAMPQDESQVLRFPPPNDQMRMLNWTLPLERLDKIARAFGHYGSIAMLDNEIRAVYAHAIDKSKHTDTPGTIVTNDNGQIKIAANGGYFIIKKSEIVG